MLSSENKRFYSSSLPIHEPPLGTGLMIRDLSASSQCSQEDKYGCSRFSSRHSSAHYSLMCEKDLKPYIGQRWREAWEYCEQCYGRDGLRVGIYCMSGKAWPGLVGLLILNSDISSFFLLFEPVWRDMCRLFTRIVGEENTVLDSLQTGSGYERSALNDCVCDWHVFPIDWIMCWTLSSHLVHTSERAPELTKTCLTRHNLQLTIGTF